MGYRRSLWQRATRGIALAGIGLAMMITGTASAQFGEAAGIAEAMQPEYYRRDVQLFADGLDMDETQQLILESLYDDYQQEFDRGVEMMHERFEGMKDELQSTSKDEVLSKVFKPIREWAGDRRILGERFLENVRLILTEDQLERWPQFEHRLYREKHLFKGQFSGEKANLFYVIRDMRLDERYLKEIEPTLREYSLALHTVLKQREVEMTSTRNDMLDSLQTQDTDKSMDAIRTQVQARLAVRKVNDDYITIITEKLPSPYDAIFNARAMERAYPRIYRPTPFQRIFDETLAMPTLVDEARPGVEQMQAQYLAELAVANAEMLGTLQQFEPDEYLDRAQAFSARLEERAHRHLPDPIRPLLQRRKEIGRGYLEQLKALVGDEFFAAIPGAERWLRAPRAITNFGPGPQSPKQINRPQSEQNSGRKADGTGVTIRDGGKGGGDS
ncbi:MAG: hypothetical protein AAF432_04695 [Planctomycetota bacterium]